MRLKASRSLGPTACSAAGDPRWILFRRATVEGARDERDLPFGTPWRLVGCTLYTAA